MAVTINEVEMLALPGEDDECPFCHHVHPGQWEPEADGEGTQTLWCEVVICGDGCCNCPCYYSRDTPAAAETLPTQRPRPSVAG